LKRVLFIGPTANTVGGIASIFTTLSSALRCEPNVSFLSIAKPSSRWRRILNRRVGVWAVLVRCCVFLRGGKVVFFSGAHNSFWEKCGWTVVAKLCGARPIMVMVDGTFPRFFSGLAPPLKAIARCVARLTATVAVQSSVWDTYYRSIFPGVTTTIVRGGVDTDFFSPAPATTVAGTLTKILYVGWMIEDKGIHDLLAAAVILNRDGMLFTLRLVGPAFGRNQELHRRIAALGLDGVAQYVGVAPSRESLRQEYQGSDVFVLASHYEGFPVALLEALSSGLACVATRVGGCSEILDEGRVGLLVEPMAPEPLAYNLKSLITDGALRNGLGRAGRQRALTHYTMGRSLESYCDLTGIPVVRLNANSSTLAGED
jgi:glycosyltransferase involved in cell wall biosynthesis